MPTVVVLATRAAHSAVGRPLPATGAYENSEAAGVSTTALPAQPQYGARASLGSASAAASAATRSVAAASSSPVGAAAHATAATPKTAAAGGASSVVTPVITHSREAAGEEGLGIAGRRA